MGKERVEKIIKESEREKEGESWPDLGKEWRGKEESGLFGFEWDWNRFQDVNFWTGSGQSLSLFETVSHSWRRQGVGSG